MHKMAKHKDHRIKSKIHNDGDLWEQFHNSLEAKTPQAVKIVWTKGHAKQIHIDKGITNIRNKRGNDKADQNADEGIQLHHKTFRNAAKRLANRHQAYTKFMKKWSYTSLKPIPSTNAWMNWLRRIRKN